MSFETLNNLLDSSRRLQLGKLIAFLMAGFPSFLVAVPLNYFLVDHLGWPEPLAYALILVFQVTVNFFVCRSFVFKDRNQNSILTQFWQFVGGILLLRVGDWALYSLLVRVFGFYYLGVQVFNILVFAIIKFKLSQKVMER